MLGVTTVLWVTVLEMRVLQQLMPSWLSSLQIGLNVFFNLEVSRTAVPGHLLWTVLTMWCMLLCFPAMLWLMLPMLLYIMVSSTWERLHVLLDPSPVILRVTLLLDRLVWQNFLLLVVQPRLLNLNADDRILSNAMLLDRQFVATSLLKNGIRSFYCFPKLVNVRRAVELFKMHVVMVLLVGIVLIFGRFRGFRDFTNL